MKTMDVKQMIIEQRGLLRSERLISYACTAVTMSGILARSSCLLIETLLEAPKLLGRLRHQELARILAKECYLLPPFYPISIDKTSTARVLFHSELARCRESCNHASSDL